MNSRAPLITLGLLLLVAAAIAIGGATLARRQETLRLPADLTPLERAADALHEEIQQLERLYESHLREIALRGPLHDEARLRATARPWVGIAQVSLLSTRGNASATHIATETLGPTLPRPTLDPNERDPFGSLITLPRDVVFDAQRPSCGWLDAPRWSVFWERRSPEEAVALLVDRPAVSGAMIGGMANKIREITPPLTVDTLGLALRDPAGRVQIEHLPANPRTPDVLTPVRSRFGQWSFAAWHPTRAQVFWNMPLLVGASALSALIALLGFMAFLQQRRALRLAGQRVSFVNHVSHELRSPLTNILLNTDLAMEALGEPEQAAPRLALVREEGQRLSRLVDNVLTFSRHEQGRLRLSANACHARSVVDGVLATFQSALERRGIAVERHDGEAACQADPDALAQIIANLVSNVEKYAGSGGLLRIESEADERRFRLRVIDAGPGIPPSESERIFRPFERVGSRINEGAAGTGLGLAIARDLAQAMGGELRLLSPALPVGAAFELELPLGQEPAARLAPVVPRLMAAAP